MFKLFHIAPFLRISLFLILGIISQRYYNFYPHYICIIGFTLCLFSISFIPYFYKRYRYRFLFGLAVAFILFLLGSWSQYQYDRKVEWNFVPQVRLYKMQLIDYPVVKPRTIQCHLRICNSVENHPEIIDKEVILYFFKDTLPFSGMIGDYLLVYVDLEKAPDYWLNQSVSATGFVFSNQYLHLQEKEQKIAFRLKAVRLRHILLEQLKKMIPDTRHYSIASALLFGYKQDMDQSIRQSFSNTGAGHVLAVSGLHFSILFGMLYSILFFIGNSRMGRMIKQLVLLPVIWGFSFLIALPPSVVRAAFMLSITGVGKVFFQRPHSINTLSLTAFMMLLYNPSYLVDVGFQLSFMAVISILVIHPYLVHRYETKNKILNYLWNLITVSIAAQIGVLPLVVYYFNQIPLIFLLTNILIIPIVTLLLAMLPFSLLVNCVFSEFTFLLYPLNKVLAYFLQTITFLDHLPYRSIDHIHTLQGFDLFLSYLACLILGLLLIRKKIFYLYVFLILVLFWLIYYLCLR